MTTLTPPGVPERRAGLRRRMQVRARISTASADEQLDAHTVDLSAGGVSLVCPQQLNPGLHCVVELGTGRPELSDPLTVRAAVCYCVGVAPGQFRVGLQFIDLSDADAQLIAAMLG